MKTSVKLLAIINPISGTKKKKGIVNLLHKHLDSTRFQLQIKYTHHPGHGSQLAKEAIHNKFDAVLAVGGDGTINEIACSLVGSNVAIGIIPCGSGNGLARHLGIPMIPIKAIHYLNKSEIHKIDTVKANHNLFVNVAGIGFDAFISHKFEKMNSRGFLSYIKAVITSFFSYPVQRYIIEENGKKHHLESFLLSFANSSQFGNNAYISPQASIHDGMINIVSLKKPQWYQIPGLILKAFTKKIDSSPLFFQLIGKEFHILQQNNLGHIDGEATEFGKEIHLKVWPQSLPILLKK